MKDNDSLTMVTVDGMTFGFRPSDYVDTVVALATARKVLRQRGVAVPEYVDVSTLRVSDGDTPEQAEEKRRKAEDIAQEQGMLSMVVAYYKTLARIVTWSGIPGNPPCNQLQREKFFQSREHLLDRLITEVHGQEAEEEKNSGISQDG